MVVTCVTVFVKKDNIKDFIIATIENHKRSVEEEGNLRFDVLQSSTDETRFFLYEAYKTEESSALHKKTKHYLKWRDTVTDWMESPRVGIAHSVITPVEESLWK